MSTVVENVNPISVEIEPKHSVTSQTGAIVEIIEPDYIVHAQRKEYKVVGDNIYIPKLYDDAPQWMKDLIGTVVDIKTAVATGNLNDALEALRTLATELEVAKNTYTMSIISSNDIDQRINTKIETLNSALLDADATILNIAQTAVTPEEASAIAINTLSASLSASGAIGSFIANMNAAFADLDSATTESINYMESAIEAEFSANATAVQTIRTYVGIDEAGASTGTGLSAYLEGSDGTIGGADSQLVNDIRVTAEGVESKFEYNSILNIGGVYKKSGFGLTTNYTSGTGTQADPYVSEFWIDASRFKFTNSAKTGSKAPFTIQADGAIPEITFNGKVTFSNVTNVPQLGSTPQEVVTAINNAQTTTINGPRITTGSIGASQITAGSITATQIAANTITASQIASNTITAYNLNTNSINLSTLTGSINWNTQILNKPSSLSSFTNDSGFVTGSYRGFTYIDAYGIYTGNITANQITTGTLNASLISVTNLSASNITTGTLTVQRLPQISDTKSITSTTTVTCSNSYVSILSLGSFGTTVGATISGTVNFPSRTSGLGSTIALSVNGTIVFEYTFPNIGANSFSYSYTGNINSVSISVKNNEALSTTVTSRNLSVVSFFK